MKKQIIIGIIVSIFLIGMIYAGASLTSVKRDSSIDIIKEDADLINLKSMHFVEFDCSEEYRCFTSDNDKGVIYSVKDDTDDNIILQLEQQVKDRVHMLAEQNRTASKIKTIKETILEVNMDIKSK